MAKKFFYRGFDVDGLLKMPLDDFIKLLPSTAKRTMTRMGLQIKTFLRKFRHHLKNSKDKPFKTHCREMVIIPEMIDARLQVYNGKEWTDFMVKPEMLGRRLGEFSHTNKLVKHSGPGIGATRGSKSVELK